MIPPTIITVIQLLVIIFLLYLTTVDVSQGWGDGELWMSAAMPVLMIIATLMYVVNRQKLRLAVIDMLVALWLIEVNVLAYTGHGTTVESALIIFNMSLLIYIALRIIFSYNHINGNLLAWGIIGVGTYQCVLGFSQLVEGVSRHAFYPVTGSFLNPGPYSAILAMGLAGVMGLHKKGNFVFILSSFMLIVLASTWSRAGLVAVFIVAAIAYRKYWLSHIKIIIPLLVVMAIGMYMFKQGSADGRLLMWIVSLKCILAAPILGSGIGSFSKSYGNALPDYFTSIPESSFLAVADVTDNAYNEFLTLGVEQGLVGMLLILSLMTFVLFRLHKENKSLAYMLVALLVFSSFSYPFHCQPYRVVLIMICAWAASQSSWYPLKVGKGLMILFSVIIIFISFGIYKEVDARVRATKDYNLISGIESRYVLDDYYELLPYMNDNHRFLFDFAKGLSAEERYNDSNDMLRRAMNVSHDPMLFVCMGNNYKKMNLSAEAERCYLKAYNMLPNRLYPLYRLMLLNYDNGNITKAKEYAKMLINLKPKVKSFATNEMKNEAKKIISE